MDKEYRIEMVLHSANLQAAGKVEAALYALIDQFPDLELERLTPTRKVKPKPAAKPKP